MDPIDPAATAERRSRISWPLALVLVALLAIGAGLWVFERLRDAPAEVLREGRAALGELRDLAAAFHTGTVVTSFVSYATEISGSSYLQFATLRQMELFERTDSRATMWGQLQLPDVVVQARAPVTYTYYLDLEGHWEMRLEEGVIRVLAPPIRHNMPALDASALTWEIRRGSVLRNEAEALERLKQGLTSMAERRAGENLPLVREMGRRKTAAFIQQWLVRDYPEADRLRIEVLFADEVPPGGLPALPDGRLPGAARPPESPPLGAAPPPAR